MCIGLSSSYENAISDERGSHSFGVGARLPAPPLAGGLIVKTVS